MEMEYTYATGTVPSYAGKELVSDLGINSYDFTARWQYPMAGRFDAPDIYGLLRPWISDYSFCISDPINYIDPSGLFTTEQEAQEYADTKYPGAKVYQDKKSRQYFVALNEDGNAAYTTGATVTRDFGPNNPYVNNGNNALNGAVYGLSAFGTANSAKEIIIEKTAETALKRTANEGLTGSKAVTQAFGKDTGLYFKYVKGAGIVGASLSNGIIIYSARKYYKNGGTSWKVGAKAALDVTMTTVGLLSPIGFGISTTYFVIDMVVGNQLWNIPN